MPPTPPLRIRAELLLFDHEQDRAYFVAFIGGQMTFYSMVRDDDGEWCRG